MKRQTIRVRIVGGKMDGHEIICFDWPYDEIRMYKGEYYVRQASGAAHFLPKEEDVCIA